MLEQVKCNLYMFEENETAQEKLAKHLADYNGRLKIKAYFDDSADKFLKRVNVAQGNTIVLMRTEKGWEKLTSKIKRMQCSTQFIYICKEGFDLVQMVNEGYSEESFIIFENTQDISCQFQKILKKIEQNLLERMSSNNSLLISYKQEDIIIPWEEITFIETIKEERNYMMVYTEHGKHIAKGTLGKLKESISSKQIYKDLKSYIINLNKVKKVNLDDNYIEFLDQQKIYFSTKVMLKLKRELKDLYRLNA
ncbi:MULTISPECIES: LytTR family DNA-binding domain-containing protein [unclassified Enterococcus]|uniref:LytTR family DNA-binding domain-containing protein n=1 Tax=unclassified Enterococcus TaxID=2608891 RepID=UPI001CE20E75|nr:MULTISPECIES: LytTR family DNA-binding domain-containing protein [unclassified Enterococcus]MCA5014239.1 LytTR family transcriptional regulator [Enterococcus sp. S23]MCA5017540.1 LytTR family transcriptional regulator [Enterococcus sp. S22(2020)]